MIERRNRASKVDSLSRLLYRRLGQLHPGRPPVHTEPAAGRRAVQSIFIRHVDCGSNNAAEQEIAALFGPVYEAQRFGFHLVASPSHADLLLLTGPFMCSMQAAALAAFRAMPEPRRMITIGDDFRPGGLFQASYNLATIPAEMEAAWIAHIGGDPPSPQVILDGLLQVLADT